MTYFCTVHMDDAGNLAGEKLDMNTTHMVFDTGYDLSHMRDIIAYHPWKVLWEMEKDNTAKFGYKFKCPVGIPA